MGKLAERFLEVEGRFREAVEAVIGARPITHIARRTALPGDRLRRILRSGQSPSLAECWAIAEGLGVDVADLLPIPRLSEDEEALIEAVRARDGKRTARALAVLDVELPGHDRVSRAKLRRVAEAADEMAASVARFSALMADATE